MKLVQFSSVAQLCPTLCDPMNHSMPGLPVHHQLPEFTQTHVHWVGDAIQPSHPLSSPFPPAPNPSQHQGLFQWVNSSHEVAKVLPKLVARVSALMWLKIALWEGVKAPLPKLLEPDKLWYSEFSIWTYILEPLSGPGGVSWTQSQYFYIKIRKIYTKWDKVHKKPHFGTADKGLHPREIKQLAQDHSPGCEPQHSCQSLCSNHYTVLPQQWNPLTIKNEGSKRLVSDSYTDMVGESCFLLS